MAKEKLELSQGEIPSVASSSGSITSEKAKNIIAIIIVLILFLGLCSYIYLEVVKPKTGDITSTEEVKELVKSVENKVSEIKNVDFGTEEPVDVGIDDLLDSNVENEIEDTSTSGIDVTPGHEELAVKEAKLAELYQALSILEQNLTEREQNLRQRELALEETSNDIEEEELQKREKATTTIYDAFDKREEAPQQEISELDQAERQLDETLEILQNYSVGTETTSLGSLLGEEESTPDTVSSRLSAFAPMPTLQAKKIKNLSALLAEGQTIRLILETAIDSTLPGKVRGKVVDDVYSIDGRNKLIEKGTTVSGDYIGNVRNGQARIFVAWNSAKTPRGYFVPLQSPGVDNLGRSGIQGDVETFFWQRFGSSMMLSIIGAASAGSGTDNRTQELGENFNRSAEIALENSINIPSIVRRDPGEIINIFVNQDIDFSSVIEVQ